MSQDQPVQGEALAEGTRLHVYDIHSVIGRGGFGITYLAWDRYLNRFCAIKEYFPTEFATRQGTTVRALNGDAESMYSWGLDRFLKEGRVLAQFDHPHIVKVISVFPHNGTAYMVMQYEQGKNLATLYRHTANVAERRLLDIVLPILDGLVLVHDAGFIHRDIKPSNIYVRDDGSSVLLDFGAARQTQGASSSLTSLISYGFAPFEQYNQDKGQQGPWTDIYALGATLYLGVTGKLPPDALARGNALLNAGEDIYQPVKQEGYSERFLRAIDAALQFRAEQRPQSIAQWVPELAGGRSLPSYDHKRSNPNGTTVLYAPGAGPAASADPTRLAHKDLRKARRRLAWVGSILLLGGVATGAGLYYSGKTEFILPWFEPTTSQQLQALLEQAATQRANGHWFSPADANVVNSLLRVLELDPGNRAAADGLRELMQREVEAIYQDLRAGRYPEATAKDARLHAAVPQAYWDAAGRRRLEQILRIPELLRLAVADMEAQRFLQPSANNAYQRYREVLLIMPDNPAARSGMARLTEHFAKQAESLLAQGKAADAAEAVAALERIDPGAASLAALRRRLAEHKARTSSLAAGLQLAEQAYRAGRITLPVKQSALYHYRRVLAEDPDNKAAQDGIARVEAYFRSLFERYLKEKNWAKARSVVQAVDRSRLDRRLLRAMRGQLQRASAASPEAKPAPPAAAEPGDDLAAINALLHQYKTALTARNLTKLRTISRFRPGRAEFMEQFFNQYHLFKVVVSGFKYGPKRRQGIADISLVDLVNKQGDPVRPGSWSRFQVVVQRSAQGRWQVVW